MAKKEDDTAYTLLKNSLAAMGQPTDWRNALDRARRLSRTFGMQAYIRQGEYHIDDKDDYLTLEKDGQELREFQEEEGEAILNELNIPLAGWIA